MNNAEVYLKNLIVYIMLLPAFIAGLVIVVMLLYAAAVMLGLDPIFMGKWA